MKEHPMIGKFVKVYLEDDPDDKCLHVKYTCELVHICETHITLWVYDAEMDPDGEEWVRTREQLQVIPIRKIWSIDADKGQQEGEMFRAPFREDPYSLIKNR